MKDSEPPPHVLVLDDDPMIAELLQDWLTESSCRTVGPAKSVAGALDLIEAGPLDGAIIDIALHDEDSYPVAEALAKRGIPFAFATGFEATGLRQRFPDALILRKPFSLTDLKAAIATFQSTRRTSPTRAGP
jgi:DNA-binding response OmpR family regulator